FFSVEEAAADQFAERVVRFLLLSGQVPDGGGRCRIKARGEDGQGAETRCPSTRGRGGCRCSNGRAPSISSRRLWVSACEVILCRRVAPTRRRCGKRRHVAALQTCMLEEIFVRLKPCLSLRDSPESTGEDPRRGETFEVFVEGADCFPVAIRLYGENRIGEIHVLVSCQLESPDKELPLLGFHAVRGQKRNEHSYDLFVGTPVERFQSPDHFGDDERGENEESFASLRLAHQPSGPLGHRLRLTRQEPKEHIGIDPVPLHEPEPFALSPSHRPTSSRTASLPGKGCVLRSAPYRSESCWRLTTRSRAVWSVATSKRRSSPCAIWSAFRTSEGMVT